MKQMGRWLPIPDILQYWAPLLMALVVAAFFVWKMWGHRAEYGPGLLWAHAIYLLYFPGRMFSALLTADRRPAWIVWERVIIAAVMLGIILLSVNRAFIYKRRKEEEKKNLVGPDEELWSPEPIVGYRISIHSLGGEFYTGRAAYCRLRDQFHDPTDAPVWGCRCGYYAMKSLSDCTTGPLNSPYAFAVIALLWGKVIECENGYRAQYMRPIGFWGHKPVFVTSETIDVSVSGSVFARTIATSPDVNRSLQFTNLPLVRTHEALNALIEKARKEFDPDAPPPYDGGHNGHR